MDRSTVTPSHRTAVSRVGVLTASRAGNVQRRAATLATPMSSSKAIVSKPFATLSSTDARSLSAMKQPPSQNRSSVGESTSMDAVRPSQPKAEKIKSFLRIKPADSTDADGFRKNMGKIVQDGPGGKPSIVMTAETRVQPSLTSSGSATIGTKAQEFVLDGIFDQPATQEAVYEATTKSMVDDLLCGKSCTLATYGMTGSGKTHTFWGEPADSELRGVVPRFFTDLFDRLGRKSQTATDGSTTHCEVEIKFLELYNDCLYDLLQLADRIASLHSLKGAVRDAAIETAYKACKVELSYINSGSSVEVSVPGAISQPIECADQAIEKLNPAMAVRRSASTGMNAHSSRSHAILQVKVISRVTTAERMTKTEALASLVDLAGSERQKRTGAAGANLKEAGAINHSLLTLGNVMKSLADQHRAPKSGVTKQSFKAWRDDLLTQILHPCLDGNSKVAFIITISPNPLDWEQSLSSLDFARRAGQITVKPVEKVIVEEMLATASADTLAKHIAFDDTMQDDNVVQHVDVSSPAISKAIRDFKLLASNLILYQAKLTETGPVPALSPQVTGIEPKADGFAVGKFVRQAGESLAASLLEAEKLKLQVLTSQADQPSFAALKSFAASPPPASGVKRPRSQQEASPYKVGPDGVSRPLRRRMSEEAFVNDAARAEFLAEDGDYAELDIERSDSHISADLQIALQVAEQLDNIRVDLETRLQKIFAGSSAASLAEEYELLVAETGSWKDEVTRLGRHIERLHRHAQELRGLADKIAAFLLANVIPSLKHAEKQFSVMQKERRQLHHRLRQEALAKDALVSRLAVVEAQLREAQLTVQAQREQIAANAQEEETPLVEDEEISFHPRMAGKVVHVVAADACTPRSSLFTVSSPKSVRLSSDLGLDTVVGINPPAACEKREVVPAAMPPMDRRPRRLVLPRTLSSQQCVETSECTAGVVHKEAEPAAPRTFIDPYFRLPRNAPEGSAPSGTSLCENSGGEAVDGETGALEDLSSEENPRSSEISADTFESMQSNENLPCQDNMAKIPHEMQPPASAMKPKKKVVLRSLIQTVQTGI